MSEPDYTAQRSVATITLDRIPATCISTAQREALAILETRHQIAYRLEGHQTYVLVLNGEEYELHGPERWIWRSRAGYAPCTPHFVLWSEDVLFTQPKTRKREVGEPSVFIDQHATKIHPRKQAR